MTLTTPEIDRAIWILSLTAILLRYVGQTPIHEMKRDPRARLAAALLATALATSFAGFPSPAQAITILAATTIVYTSISRASETDGPSKRRAAATLIGIWLTAFLTIELLTATRWILNGFDGQPPFSDPSWSTALLELQLTNILQPILPRLFVLFAAAWLLRILLTPYEEPARTLATRILKTRPRDNSGAPDERTGNPTPIIILGISIAAAIFIGVYPYLPALNPPSQLVGVDTGYYYNWMNTLNHDPNDFTNITQTDRPLALALQQTLAATAGPDVAIRLIPTLLATLLTLSTYLLVSTGLKDRRLAAVAALLTPVSFQTLAGINAAFYANWLALTEILLLLTLLLRALNKENHTRRYTVLASLTGVAILFTHSATWIVLMATLAAYTAILFTRRTLRRPEAAVLTPIILTSLAAELLKRILLQNATTSGVAQTMMPNVSPENLLHVFQTLDITFTYFLGGAYANPLILILATLGLAHITKSHNHLHQLLLALTVVCTLGTFFTASNMPDLLQSRFIYLIPFQILAATGLNTLTGLSRSVFDERTGTIGRLIPIMLQLIVFTSLLSYALRVTGFIYTV